MTTPSNAETPLLDCPFCKEGGRAVFSIEDGDPKVKCEDCGVYMKSPDAVRDWNNRRAAVPSKEVKGEILDGWPTDRPYAGTKSVEIEWDEPRLKQANERIKELEAKLATADKPEAGKVDVLQSKADFFQKKGEMLQRSVERLRGELSTAQASLKCADHKIELLEDALKKQCWCAYCGKFGDHQSGWCLQLKLDKSQASLKQANARILELGTGWNNALIHSSNAERHLNGQIDELKAALLQAQAEAAAYRKALESIDEYWSGNLTESAMKDACEHNIRTAQKALSGTSANALIERLKAYEEALEKISLYVPPLKIVGDIRRGQMEASTFLSGIANSALQQGGMK